MVHGVAPFLPHEVFAFAEKSGARAPAWVLARETLRTRVTSLHLAGFDKVWFAVKACPLIELAREAVAAGAGLMLTFAREARRLAPILSMGVPWGFALRDPGSQRDLKWVLDRFSPEWVSLGHEDDVRFTITRLQALQRNSLCVFRVRPPPDVRSVCGLYGFPVGGLVGDVGASRPAGIHFHIGSNKSSGVPYIKMLRYAREWWDAQRGWAREPQVLNIGGGFATCYRHFTRIAEEARRLFPESELWIEPGRYLTQRVLYWVARCRVAGEEIHLDGCLPVSTEAHRPPYRVNAFLLPERLTSASTANSSDGNQWFPVTGEIAGANRIKVLNRGSTRKNIPPGQAMVIFYDCAAYSCCPADPVILRNP